MDEFKDKKYDELIFSNMNGLRQLNETFLAILK